MEQLLEVMEECNWLHEYKLTGNPMGDMTAYTLLRIIKPLPHIIHLDVSDKINPLLYKQLGDVAAVHRKEWTKRNKKKKKGAGKKKKTK